MRPLLVRLLQPRIQVGLEVRQRPIDLLAERHAVEFVQHRLVEPFTDPVGLGMPRLGARVLDVLHRQVEFILMALRRAALLRASIGENPGQRNLVLFEERQHAVIEQIGGRHRDLAVVQLRKAHFAVGVDEGLKVC